MKHYVWLLPTGKEALRLQQIITDLARGFSQPVFPAHLTLWSGDCSQEHALNWILNHQNLLPISVQIQPPTFAESFYRCVYIPVLSNPQLTNIHQNACQAFQKNTPFDPHISIMYGEHSLARRRDVSSNLDLYFSTIQLSQWALVQGSSELQKWQILHRIPLPIER